jgi:hypothetical protein
MLGPLFAQSKAFQAQTTRTLQDTAALTNRVGEMGGRSLHDWRSRDQLNGGIDNCFFLTKRIKRAIEIPHDQNIFPGCVRCLGVPPW